VLNGRRRILRAVGSEQPPNGRWSPSAKVAVAFLIALPILGVLFAYWFLTGLGGM